MKESVQALQMALSEHLPWHGAQLNFLARFLLALFKVRRVNLAEWATGFGGKAQAASSYKRLQRFFRGFEIDHDVLARRLVHLFPAGRGPWYLTLDRTNWKFGKAEINFLILGIAQGGMALPVMWPLLDKAGNSDTPERVALLQRFLRLFGRDRIKALLADREFVGGNWFAWLQAQGIPFHIRLKRNTLIPNSWNVPRRADVLFGSLAPGQFRHLVGRRPIWGGFVHLSALRLEDGDFLIVASSGVPPQDAFAAYACRWGTETLFGALKSRGFNLEDTYLTHVERLDKLLALLALAFAWTLRIGETLAARHPIPFKKLSSLPSNPSSGTGALDLVNRRPLHLPFQVLAQALGPVRQRLAASAHPLHRVLDQFRLAERINPLNTGWLAQRGAGGRTVGAGNFKPLNSGGLDQESRSERQQKAVC